MSDLLLTGIRRLVTNDRRRGGLLGLVHDAAVAVEDGRIAWVGAQGDLPDRHRDGRLIDCEARAVLPGFVDPHTHLVFAGDRAEEFAERLAGRSYRAGGIMASVTATRAADRERLTAQAERRCRRLLATGTTTAEVKSGYGLDVATERRMLQVVADLDAALPIDLVPTWLGAHAVPPDRDRGDFLDEMIDQSLPACAPLARWADVFCDEGAFTVAEARRVLEAARAAGLGLRLHADELAHSGGARLAASLGCASADHLAHADPDDAAALATADVVGVLLPATTFCLGTHHYAPGPTLWEAGVTVALGTDLNPGTAYVESMPFVIALACVEMGLSPAQAVWAATRGGALALELPDRGRLVPGAVADLMVLDAPSHLHLAYRPASDLVTVVIKRGEVVVGGPPIG